MSYFVGHKFCIIIGAAVLFMGESLQAKIQLSSGEKLSPGEFLVSENGRFKMGLNDEGALVIVDQQPRETKEITRSKIKNWDGKTYWTARFVPDPHGRAPRPILEYKPKDPLKVHHPGHWRINYATAHGDFMFPYKSLGSMASYQVKGAKVLKLDFSGLSLWDNPDKHNPMWRCNVRTANARCDTMLLLENCGRAIVISELNELLWCSCPFCDDWTGKCDDWNAGVLRRDIYNFQDSGCNLDFLEMPPHANPATEGATSSPALPPP